MFWLSVRLLYHCWRTRLRKQSVDQIKKDKLSDQANIIDLQNELIEAKDKKVKKLQETEQSEVKSVQSKMKTIPSVPQKEIMEQSSEVQKNVVSAVNVRKVSDAVKMVVEKEDKGKNVVIYRVPEGSTETLETRVGSIVENLGQKPRIVDCCRLGKETERSVPPVKVTRQVHLLLQKF